MEADDKEKDLGTGLDSDFVKQVKAMSDKAEESRRQGRQLGLGIPDEEDVPDIDMAAAVGTDLQNPDESHRIYYAIRRLLMDDLPPGEENEDLRRVVYDEKNLFINRGHDLDSHGIRGSDGRMGYIPHLKIALRLVKHWVAETGSAFDIFVEFWQLNEKMGYHKGQQKRKQPAAHEEPLNIKGTLDDVLRAAARDDND